MKPHRLDPEQERYDAIKALEPLPLECPTCSIMYDDFGFEVVNPDNWEKMNQSCDECRSMEIYYKLTHQDCESFINLYNLQRHYPEYIAKFWVWMAETLKVEIHIAKRIITLIESES